MVTFAQKLKELRESAGLTQTQLAERVGISRVTLARLETSKTVPTWPVVYDLARALKVSCEAFPTMERSMGPKPAGKKPTPKKGKGRA
jgi:putative transcriptional regulator